MLTRGQTTQLEGPKIPAKENPMSRRYLRVLQRWIPVGMEYFADWPDRPGCGHFLGGVHWYGNETEGPAEAFAAASISPEHDEGVTGASREAIKDVAIRGLRYLCFTHDTGPRDWPWPAGELLYQVGREGKGILPGEPVRRYHRGSRPYLPHASRSRGR